MITIRYGINRPRGPRKRDGRDHQSHGPIEVDGVWGDDDTHTRIRAEIRKRHPGWMVTGYALVNP